VRTYADEVANTAVRVNLVNPGPTRTRMRVQAYPGEDPATLKTPEDVAEAFVRLAEPACTNNGRLFDLRSGEVK
jgi:NAD(P)-dependent dehydrogenase (short-subunit alcohol dehydrogenase family)